MKKNILKKICIFILSILIFTTSVMAENEQQEKQYDLKDIGMKISLNNELIEIVSSLKSNDENVSKIENKEKYIQNYKNAGIVLDAVDNTENPTREILIAGVTSSNYINMANFNEFSEEEKNTYKEKIIETFKQQVEQSQEEKTKFSIKENSIVKTNNGNDYINIKTILQNEENNLEMSIYYTIVNGRLITTSFRYYQNTSQEILEQEQQIIENISFYEIERPQNTYTSQTMKLAWGFTIIAFAILTIIVIAIRIKDRKYLDKNIKDIKIKQYSKFGGLLLLFWTLCFYQLFLRVIEINNVSKIEGMTFYVGAITVQSTILAVINMYQIYVTLKRKTDTPKKLIRANIAIMATGLLVTAIRIIYAWINPMELYDAEYFKQEFNVLLFSILYPMLCAIYFTFSKRVQTYYYLPNKSYKEIWKNLIKKRGGTQNNEK